MHQHHAIDDDVNNTGDDSDSIYGTGRTRYLALKERRNRLARSRSSHVMANDDDNDSSTVVSHLDEPVSPTTANPNAYLASRCDVCINLFVHFLAFLFMPRHVTLFILLFRLKKTHNLPRRWKKREREIQIRK